MAKEPQKTIERFIAFTPNQLKAIKTIDKNLQIVACAGAGKTQVLAERVIEILARRARIRPKNIVAFTFTERAGAELKDRINQRYLESFGDTLGLAEMYVGTIHGYCLQLLQSHMPDYFKYRVLNEVQARLLVDRASVKSGLSASGLRRYLESRLYLEVLGVLREADVKPSKLKGHEIVEALEMYKELLDSKHCLDYTEIMVRAVSALEKDESLRSTIGDQVRYLIVDEYQDINPLQEHLIELITGLGANVCVVGDDDQTIYQWRGSDVSFILGFKKRYPAVASVPIEENYRSSKGVVDGARTVIEHNDPGRLKKTMVSTEPQEFELGDVLCLDFANPEKEATWIAKKAKSLIGTPFKDTPDSKERGLAPSDIAILLRSVRNTGDPIVKALREAGLNVVVVGMTGLFEQPEIEAAVALFDFMVLKVDEKDLEKAWLDADLGIDKKLLCKAIAWADDQREWKDADRWSTYNLQRTFLEFLEMVGMREEDIPGDRGELVYYNLGKFSQVISDFEQVHFQSEPQRKYETFSGFLQYQAPGYYPEGWQDAGYVRPNAVQVMTVHQAKGMEWPVVFVPCLQKNRFPGKKQGGKGKWHVIPRDAVVNADSYDGSDEDERRLFYVALTRSKKFLFCSWAPDPGNQLYRKPSMFIREFTGFEGVLTDEPRQAKTRKIKSVPINKVANAALSFSELKYFFECPYQFKLRFVYGFNPPIHEALGYGKSLHDVLADIHKSALVGDVPTEDDAGPLMDRHLSLPFAYPELRDDLRESGTKAVIRYLRNTGHLLGKTEYVEQVVEINLGDGLVVNGRIDLIRRTDTKELIIIDFKSTERAQEEEVSRTQLHVYALGYRQLTGESADLIEVYNLDEKGKHTREKVSPEMEEKTRDKILKAGASLRENKLTRISSWCEKCAGCDVNGICRSKK